MNFKELYKPCSRITKYMHHSVFEEINHLAKERNAINMAQGYPDWQPPSFVKDSLQEAAQSNESQYTKVSGHPKLVKVISEEYSPKLGREISPDEEITIANGAVGVLNNFMFAFLEDDDEVIVFEPTYPFMHPLIELYRGKMRFASLESPKGDSNDWTFNFEELEKLFNERTKAIVVNTPHNPTGKAIKKSEYDEMIKILNKWPKVIVLADELYEHVMYDDVEHVRIASLPGMWERTVSVYSGGKIFSVTGWRIGWGIGPSYLIKPMVAAQTWTTFSINTPAQAAIADALHIASTEGSGEGHATFYQTLKANFQKKKDRLLEVLKACDFGYKVIQPEGGYFIIVDITEAIPKIPTKYFYEEGKSDDNKPVKSFAGLENPSHTPDLAFVRWLIYDFGVASVPLYPFYEPSRDGPKNQRGAHFVRFTICKEDDVIETVYEKLVKQKASK